MIHIFSSSAIRYFNQLLSTLTTSHHVIGRQLASPKGLPSWAISDWALNRQHWLHVVTPCFPVGTSASLIGKSYATRFWELGTAVLTRPSIDPTNLVDTSVEACASRLLELHPDTRSIIDLYPVKQRIQL
jgi:hypothetical protein